MEEVTMATADIDVGFTIDTDAKAEWAIKKIRDAQQKRDRLSSLVQAEMDALKQKSADIQATYDSETSNLMAMLEQYAQTVPLERTKTTASYQLLSGKLVFKRGTPEFARDDTRLLAWLKDSGRDNFIKTAQSVDWSGLKKSLAVMGDVMVDNITGEIVEGVTVKDRPDTFTIKMED